MSDSAPEAQRPVRLTTAGPDGTPPTPGPAAAAPRRIRPLGRVLIGLSAVSWLMVAVVVVLMVFAFLAGELEGMAALSGVVIIAFALAAALLVTGGTMLHLYLARRRERTR